MATLFGYIFLVSRLIGVAVILATLSGALIYHLGWRNDHPEGFWPMRSVLGFGGALLSGVGLVLGSLMLMGIGVLAYFAGLMFGGDSRPPAAP